MHFAILFSPSTSTLDMLVAKTLLSILGKGEKAAENLAKVTDVSPKAFGRPGCLGVCGSEFGKIEDG